MFLNKILSIFNIINISVFQFKISLLKFGAKGSNVDLCLGGRFLYPENLFFDEDVYVGPNSFFSSFGKVEIGRGSIIGPNFCVFTANHNFEQQIRQIPYDSSLIIKPVKIGRGVWIGANVIILPGVSIGDGAVIGAGSVVAKDVLDFCVAVGNPARTVRERSNKEDVEKLLRENNYYLKYKKAVNGKKI